VSDEPGVPAGGGDQRELVAWLRVVIEAKDAENAVLRAELEAQLERYRRLELRVAELERRLGSDSTTSGTPPSKGPIRARERRTAERKARQSSERDRRADRRRGGQPGHPGAGLSRDPDPDERGDAPPPAQCSRCGTALDGADRAGSWWSQVRDVRITMFVTEYVLPLLACPCCGKINAAQAPPWAHPGSVSYGPGINTAAVLLTSYGNVPAERAANLIGMLLGVPVSAGFVDRASQRLASRLDGTGFDEAMQTALAARPVLAADETPVNLIDAHAGLAAEDAGAPHVLVVRTPRAGLTWLRALGSRQAAAITAVVVFFTGFLISDGYDLTSQPRCTIVQFAAARLVPLPRCFVSPRAKARSGAGNRALDSHPADLTKKWADDFRKLVRVVVVGRMRAGRGGDIHAQTAAEPGRDLREEGKAVLADEQAHGHGDGRQGLIVGQVQLVGPELSPEQGAGGGAHALTKLGR
jgi:transposase